jgi:acetyl esterase/lipase
MRMSFRSVSIAAAWLAGASTIANAEPVVTSNIEYARANGQALLLDLYKPEGNAPAPLLIWVHGGAWEAGRKTPMPLTALVDRGYAVASVDFRPASTAPFPGQIHDIKAAVRFLRAQANRYGYDASRIGMLGASSGGHLAALVAVTAGNPELEGELGEHRTESSSVQAVVSYFGASNLTTILAQSTPFGLNVRVPALQRLLGAAPEDNEAAARLASPVFHVDRADPPLLMLHGDQDRQMPINQSHELEAAYEAAGAAVALTVVHGAGHGGDEFFSASNVENVAAFLDAEIKAKRERPGT